MPAFTSFTTFMATGVKKMPPLGTRSVDGSIFPFTNGFGFHDLF